MLQLHMSMSGSFLSYGLVTILYAGMVKVVAVLLLSALFLGESSIFTLKCATLPVASPKPS